MKKSTILLASQSARRRDILKSMKIPFRVIPSSYKERKIRCLKPQDLALKHALGKAMRAETSNSKGLVLGADTVVWCRGQALGKPKSKKEALGMLQLLSNKRHEVVTALALMDLGTRYAWLDFAVTKVKIRKLSQELMAGYVEAINPYDKAGGYAIQRGPRIVTEIQGSYSNVVGLPRELLRAMLRKVDEEL